MRLALLTSVADSANDFLTLARENYAELVTEIVLKVNDSRVGVDMSRSLKHKVHLIKQRKGGRERREIF